MRKILLGFLSFVLFVGSLILLVVSIQAQNYQLRGYENPTQQANLPFKLPVLGVNADLRQYPPDQLQQNITQMKQANIRWIRQFVYWDEIEPQQGQYDWSRYDLFINALAQEPSIELILVVMNAPSWSSTQIKSTPTTAPDDPQSMANFVAQLATRYGNVVDYYQIWDEPNLYEAWGNTNPQPTHYFSLLQASYTAIHENDTQATVIAAALAPTTEASGRNISDWLYLQTLYTLGVAQYSDGIAGKAYGFNLSPQDRDVLPNKLNFSRIIGLREVMLKNNDAQTHLWLSEGGWNSLPQNWQGEPSIWGKVSAEIQSYYTQRALVRVDREWAWAGAFTLSYWQPNLPQDNPRWGFALKDQTNTPAPLLQELQNTPVLALPRNGLYPPQNSFATYSGVWTFGELGADIGWLETSDSRVSFRFWGRDVSLLLRKGDYVAFLYPTIDGTTPNATQTDSSGNAYVFLQSASLQPELVLSPISQELSYSEHTLSVIADRGWDQWALVGFAVSDGDLATPYKNQVTVALIVTVVTGLAFCVTSLPLVKIAFLRAIQVITPLNETFLSIIAGFTSLILMLSLLWTFGDGTPQILRREANQLGLAIVVSGGLIALEPPFLLVLVACAILFVLIYDRLYLGLALVLLWSPFFLFPVELFRFAFPLAELILWITFGAWLIHQCVFLAKWLQIRNPQFPLRVNFTPHSLDLAVLGMAGLAFISLAWAQNRSSAVTEFRTIIIEPALFYMLLRLTIHTPKVWIRLIDCLILAGFLVCIIGIIAFIRGDAIITAEDGARRLASVYGSPNNVGLLLGRCLPFAWSFILLSMPSKRRIIMIIVALTMLFTVFLTQSTGAILFGIPGGFVAVIILCYGKKSFAPLFVLLALGSGFVIVLTQISARFAKLLTLSDGTNFIRLRVWESALAIIREHPITGLGLDQFLYAFRSQYIKPDAIQDMNLSHPHNILFDFWIRLGLGGVIVLIWIQLAFWRTSVALLQIVSHDTKIILIGVMGSMVATLAHGLIDNSVFVLDLSLIFAFSLALTVNFSRSHPIDEHHKE
jgi:O-antigen ligase